MTQLPVGEYYASVRVKSNRQPPIHRRAIAASIRLLSGPLALKEVRQGEALAEGPGTSTAAVALIRPYVEDKDHDPLFGGDGPALGKSWRLVRAEAKLPANFGLYGHRTRWPRCLSGSSTHQLPGPLA